MDKLTCKIITEKVSQIKKNAGDIYSNYLPLIGYSADSEFNGYIGDDTVIYMNARNIVNRIIFFSSDRNELISLLKKCPKGLGIDLHSKMRKIKDDYILEADFHKVATLQRLLFYDGAMQDEELMKNDKFRVIYQYRNDNIVEYAKESDMAEIDLLLKTVFDSYIDHLPTEKELVEEFIKPNGMLIYRANGRILALVGFIIIGKKMFWQYAINRSGDYRIMAALVVRSRDIALEKNVKLMYTFLELSEKRKKAFKYYQRRDAVFDNFYNHVYSNAKDEENKDEHIRF